MRRLYLFPALLFLLSLITGTGQYSFGQQWSATSVPHGRSIYSIHLLNSNTVIATGGRLINDSLQSAFKSINKGLSWHVNYDMIAPMINSTAFYNSQEGYGVGNNGKTIKTSDGGETWNASASPLNRHFYEVTYSDEQTLIAVGGKITGDDTLQTIVKSNDDGETWTTIIDQPGSVLKSVCFINADTGFSVGYLGCILVTTDGGNNWNHVASPIQRDFNAVYFVNESIGFIAGGIQSGTAKRTLLKTSNGGQSWNSVLDENGARLNAISFYDALSGYAVGDSATVLKTIDGGQSWQTENVIPAPDSAYFNCVQFSSANFGVIGSTEGLIYTYADLTLPEAIATGAAVSNNTDATLSASINGNGNAFVYSFMIDTDSTLAGYSETFETEAFNSAPASFTSFIPGLVTDTVYYYCVKARNLSGTVYSDTIPFYTGSIYSVFEANPPTQITGNTARINATADQLQHTATLEFQYGTTPLFGNEIAAVPSQINDPGFYQPYADLTGLQNNTVYYYRLKATFPNSTEIFSNTRYFYNGDNTIPNWDFQLWDTAQAVLLNGWSFVGDNFQRVTGHTGNYALRIAGDQLAFLGNLAFEDSENDPGFYGGAPFNYRPDSVYVDLNYSIESGDTAWMIIKLYSDPHDPVSMQFYPVTGNSGGQFEQLGYELDYFNSGMPDSVLIGFIPTNPFDTIEQHEMSPNYLVIDNISFGNVAPVVFNADFESWRTEEYELLKEWSPHIYFENDGDPALVQSSLFAAPADYAARLKNRFNSSGELLGAEISTARSILSDGIPDFPVNARHGTLSGYYKYLPQNNDTMEVKVDLYYQGEHIGSGSFVQYEQVPDFTRFDIVLNYNNSLVPDSAAIQAAAFKDNPKGESILEIDKLRFDDPGIQVGSPGISKNDVQYAHVFPNPGKESVTLHINNFRDNAYTIRVLTPGGTHLLQQLSGSRQTVLNTSSLPAGFYLIKIEYATTSEIIKWIKN